MITDRQHETTIEVPEDLPMIRIVREFDAPAERVFKAHIDPDLYLRWVGPDSLDGGRIDVWEARDGGEWRYCSTHQGQEHWFRGCFHTVRSPSLVIQTWCYEPYGDSASLERLELEDLPGGRSRLTATSLVDSFETRDAIVSSGMEVGVVEGYRKLDAMLAEGA